MDEIKNPFSPGAGSPPPELVGRSSILRQTEILLGRTLNRRPEKSMLLTGLRGVGKTVLLNEMERLAQQHGYHTICVEKITTAMPEVNPVVTGNGMKRISAPMRQKPRIMRKRPAISVQTSSPDAWYCSSTPMMMMTKAPVGPPIWYLLPLNRDCLLYTSPSPRDCS